MKKEKTPKIKKEPKVNKELGIIYSAKSLENKKKILEEAIDKYTLDITEKEEGLKQLKYYFDNCNLELNKITEAIKEKEKEKELERIKKRFTFEELKKAYGEE